MSWRIVPCLLLACLAAGPGTKKSAAAEIEFESDIEYSNPQDEHLKLNLARPKQIDGLAPAVVCIHGGGFRAGNRQRWDAVCRQLAERGYVAVTATYRLAPKHPFPAAVSDVKAAVRVAARQCRAAEDRSRSDRHAGRLGRRSSGAIPGSDRRRQAV